MTAEQQLEVEQHLMQQRSAVEERLPAIRKLIFRVGATPRALELNIMAKEISDRLQKRDQLGRLAPVTEASRMAADKEIDAILNELETLSMLTPEQIQKEYESVSEDEIPFVSGG